MSGHIAVCIASGPSLTQEDVDFCKDTGAKIYAVNDCYRMARWANYVYAADPEWWDAHAEAVGYLGAEAWTCNPDSAQKYNLNYIRADSRLLWSGDPTVVASGGNSGFQTINLAVLHGATKVVLLGYDMQLGVKGKKHWFGDHPPGVDRGSNYGDWLARMRKAAPMIPVPVFNCSRDTAIDCFPRKALKDVL